MSQTEIIHVKYKQHKNTHSYFCSAGEKYITRRFITSTHQTVWKLQ